MMCVENTHTHEHSTLCSRVYTEYFDNGSIAGVGSRWSHVCAELVDALQGLRIHEDQGKLNDLLLSSCV